MDGNPLLAICMYLVLGSVTGVPPKSSEPPKTAPSSFGLLLFHFHFFLKGEKGVPGIFQFPDKIKFLVRVKFCKVLNLLSKQGCHINYVPGLNFFKCISTHFSGISSGCILGMGGMVLCLFLVSCDWTFSSSATSSRISSITLNFLSLIFSRRRLKLYLCSWIWEEKYNNVIRHCIEKYYPLGYGK